MGVLNLNEITSVVNRVMSEYAKPIQGVTRVEKENNDNNLNKPEKKIAREDEIKY